MGYFADQGNHSGSGMKYTNLMYLQEVHGVKSKVGLVHRRLFELTMMTKKQEIIHNLRQSVRRNLYGSPNTILKDFGQDVQGKLKSSFGDSSLLPSNAPSVSARKGSNSPLVDTGELRDKLTYRIIKSKD